MNWVVAAIAGAMLLSVAVTGWVAVPPDEAWELEVVRRVLRGDRLYRDVFYGAGPVAVWLAAAAVRLFRPQVVVLRAMTLAYDVAVWTVGAAVIVSAGDRSAAAALFVLGAFTLGGHQLAMTNHYTQLSSLGVVIAAFGVVEGGWLLVGAGLAIAVAGRYPVGVFCALWMLPLYAADAGVGAAAAAAGVLVGGLVAVALVLGRDGVGSFVAVAVSNKPTYLRTGKVRPFAGAGRRLGAVPPSPPARIVAAIPPLAVAVATLLGVGIVVAGVVLGLADRSTTLVLGAGAAATGLAMAYPRADFNHLAAAMPLVLLGTALVGERWVVPGWAVAATVAALFVVALAGIAWPPLVAARGIHRRDLPHLRLLPVWKRSGVWPDETDELVAIAGATVFVVRRDAPYFYVAGGLIDPTPYDLPHASTFGADGQDRIVEAMRTGELRWVCYPGPMGGPNAPVAIERYLEALSPVAKTPVGLVYDTAAS